MKTSPSKKVLILQRCFIKLKKKGLDENCRARVRGPGVCTKHGSGEHGV